MITNEEKEILINKYLAPKWRKYAMNPEPYHIPLGYMDALKDAIIRRLDDLKEHSTARQWDALHPTQDEPKLPTDSLSSSKY